VGDRTPRDLQDAFLDNGAPLVDYLESDKDFAFMVYPWPDYFGSAPKASATGRHIMPMPLKPEQLGSLRDLLRPPLGTDRAGRPLPDLVHGGQALIGRFLLALSKRASAELRTETACDGLIREGDTVVGAVVAGHGRRYRIRTRRGVLVASGGFERNAEMRARHGVPGDVRDAMSPAGNLGRAIQAGIDVGAGTDLMSEAWWSPGITHPDGRSTFSLWFTGGIFVDDQGERFVNESWAYDRIGRVVIDRMDQGLLTLPFWMIYDDRAGVRPPVRSASVPLEETRAYEAAGLWVGADTLKELADRIGVPAGALAATVERFNAFAEAGADEEFGRGAEPYDRSFADGASPLVPIERGPFHAAAFGLSDLGTKGGLRTDPRSRVLRADGTVIAGLYAAGNSSAAVMGHSYAGAGSTIGPAMTFGYIAADNLAQGA
jgi:hypothetical protein